MSTNLTRVSAGRRWLILRRQAGRGSSRQERSTGHLLYHVCGLVLCLCEARKHLTSTHPQGPGRQGVPGNTAAPGGGGGHALHGVCGELRGVHRPRRVAPVDQELSLHQLHVCRQRRRRKAYPARTGASSKLRCGVPGQSLTHPSCGHSRRSGWAKARFLCATSTRAGTCSATTAASTTQPTTPQRLGARTKPQTTGRGRARPACVQCVLACTFGMTPAATEPLLRARTTASERLESSLTFQNTSWRT